MYKITMVITQESDSGVRRDLIDPFKFAFLDNYCSEQQSMLNEVYTTYATFQIFGILVNSLSCWNG